MVPWCDLEFDVVQLAGARPAIAARPVFGGMMGIGSESLDTTSSDEETDSGDDAEAE